MSHDEWDQNQTMNCFVHNIYFPILAPISYKQNPDSPGQYWHNLILAMHVINSLILDATDFTEYIEHKWLNKGLNRQMLKVGANMNTA